MTTESEVAAFMESQGFFWDKVAKVWLRYNGGLVDLVFNRSEATFWYTVMKDRERAARIDELSKVQLEHSRFVTTTFVSGKELSIDERIAQLKKEGE